MVSVHLSNEVIYIGGIERIQHIVMKCQFKFKCILLNLN